MAFEPGLVEAVRSNTPEHRAGMPTTARVPDGSIVLAYEFCNNGRPACEDRVKRSVDGGRTWGEGPADIGSLIETFDGRYAAGGPNLSWAGGADGQLMLAANHAHRVAGDAFAPENYDIVFVNDHQGEGPWSWIPAPAPVAAGVVQEDPGGVGHCYPNYSPFLLPSVDGTTVRYSSASQNPSTDCAERTTAASAGVLPYRDPFAGGYAGGWHAYEGCWSVEDGGVYRDTCAAGRGDKAVTGSTGWSDYVFEGELRLDEGGGHAGFLLRVSDGGPGIDNQVAYFVGLSETGFFLGRHRHDWTELAQTPVNGAVGTWYRVGARLDDCHLTLELRAAADDKVIASLDVSDTDACIESGAIGVRAVDAGASFRRIRVRPPVSAGGATGWGGAGSRPERGFRERRWAAAAAGSCSPGHRRAAGGDRRRGSG